MSFSLMIVLTFIGCASSQEISSYALSSPSENNEIIFQLDEKGAPYYQVYHEKKMILESSFMGFQFQNFPNLTNNLSVVSFQSEYQSETWEMPWGEQREVLNEYNELVILLADKGLPEHHIKCAI